MTPRKRLEGALAEWHPHPKSSNNSLVPVVRSAPPGDDIADRFFDSSPQGYTPEPPVAAEAVDPSTERRSLIHSPAARERRRYLMRYVAGAVGVAALIGAGAMVRAGVRTMPDANAATSPAAAAEIARATAAEITPATETPEPAPVQAPATVAVGEAPAATTEPAAPATATVVAPETAPDAPTPPAAATDTTAQAQATDTAVATPPDAAGAAAAKREAQHALELGRLKTSVEAGERSVALDPTDAEAWLILGAAYQERGRYKDARRCFTSCSTLATRGPRSECRALLR
jgi:hypothetical protein